MSVVDATEYVCESDYAVAPMRPCDCNYCVAKQIAAQLPRSRGARITVADIVAALERRLAARGGGA